MYPKTSLRIPLKCPLDALLGGGIETRTITQLYGEPNSGKTNICLLAIKRFAEEGKRAIYVDTEGSWSIERLKQISGDKFSKVLEKIIFFEPTEFEEQHKIILSLENLIKEEREKKEKDHGMGNEIKLIVLDSAVSLYRVEKTEENLQEMNRALTMQVARLSRIARKYDIACMITSQIYSSYESENIEPIAGFILKYWCKIIIELKRINSEIEAKLVRHRDVKEKLKVRFVITEKGIEGAKYSKPL